jgi:hypothetical protein
MLLERLAGVPGSLPTIGLDGDPLRGEDFHLALYLCYELHYRDLAGVDPRWEWEPSLIGFRGGLESAFEAALEADVGPVVWRAGGEMGARLREIVATDEGPSLARHVARGASVEEIRELVVHRSGYQLKEADPQSFAIPRLRGRPKAALVEVQFDEYGAGRPERIHAELYAEAMRGLGLDGGYGVYLDLLPGVTLATVNTVSLFGLHRRRRGASVGHLALTEMTSSEANRRYAGGLRRLGFDGAALDFFDEHVEADAVHEAVAVHDMAGALAAEEPALAADVLFGALALLSVERRFAEHLLGAWGEGRSSLRAPLEPSAVETWR